jgi:hypothetical protein
MDLQLEKIPEHDFRLIVVPGELLKQPVSNYKHIKAGNDVYDIYTEVIHNKGEVWSSSLPLLSTGVFFTEQQVFEKYPNSNRIIFFLCRKRI